MACKLSKERPITLAIENLKFLFCISESVCLTGRTHVNRVIRVKIKPGLFLSVFVQKVCLVVIVGFLEVPLSLLRFGMYTYGVLRYV